MDCAVEKAREVFLGYNYSMPLSSGRVLRLDESTVKVRYACLTVTWVNGRIRRVWETVVSAWMSDGLTPASSAMIYIHPETGEVLDVIFCY